MAVAEARALAELDPVDAATPGRGAAAQARTRLTAREGEVLRRLTEGQSDKEIAAGMGISRRTASRQVAALRARLGASSRAAAVAIAMRDLLV